MCCEAYDVRFACSAAVSWFSPNYASVLPKAGAQLLEIRFPPPQDDLPCLLEALLDFVMENATQTNIDAPVLTNVVEDETIIVGFEKMGGNGMQSFVRRHERPAGRTEIAAVPRSRARAD